MYKALDIAKYIISKGTNDGEPISNLQLQKILYYIQSEFLQSRNNVAFDDDIEAWQFGPVVPNVYYYFCGYGAMKIMNYYDEDFSLNYEDRQIIDKIIIEKRDMDPWQLVEETHRAGGAWDKTYKKGFGNREVISIALIKQEIANA